MQWGNKFIFNFVSKIIINLISFSSFFLNKYIYSSYLHTGVVEVKTLKLNKLKSLRNHGGADRALLSFDLNADMSPAFHWY